MHRTIHPAILYFGTPVILISTVNGDGTFNLAPMSSVFWLGWRCLLGLAASSQTTGNLMRSGECVLNLPSVSEVDAIDRLALTTGSNPVPEFKRAMGYRYEPDKFAAAGLTPVASATVAAPRVRECPVHLEASVATTHAMGEDDPSQKGRIVCLEARIQRVHADESILMAGEAHRIDPDAWRPVLMSFQQLYGLGGRLRPSRLATVPERLYRARHANRGRP
jgi:flavin reductase (DIM6/NTAB) family NADH-FMN oxidoreductase RutF